MDTRALDEKVCLIISNMLDSNNICSADCGGAFAKLQTCWSAGARNALPSSGALLRRAMNCSNMVLCMLVRLFLPRYAMTG